MCVFCEKGMCAFGGECPYIPGEDWMCPDYMED